MTTAAAQPTTNPNPQSTIAPEASASSGSVGSPRKEQGSRITYDLLRRQMSHCGEYTYQALNKVGKLSPEDTSRISQQYLKYISQVEKGKPFEDALCFLVIHGWKKSEIEARDVMLELTKGLIRYSKTKITHLSFAQQTETPLDFYNNFPAISEICRLLSCPIIQVNEKDFFMVTSVNPFTATAASRIISNEIEAEVGRKPFAFSTTTDLNSWRYACERHFGT